MRLLSAILLLAPLAAEIRFERQILQESWGVVYAVSTADVNGDGKLDVVALNPSQLAWFENPTWKKHVVLDGATKKDNVAFAMHDIDGDGKLDAAIGADWQPTNTQSAGTIGWAKQTQSGLWEYKAATEEPTTHRMKWGDVDGDGKAELIVAPLHGRGTKAPDWLGQGARMLVFKMPDWKMEVADDSLHIVHNFTVVGNEIWTASVEGVHALRRDASGRWSKRKIADGQPGEIKLGTINTVRHLATVEPWHGTSLVVYEEPHVKSDPNGAALARHKTIPNELWKRTVVDPNLTGGHAIGWGDLDGDGSDELVAGWRLKPHGVAFYKRDLEGKWARTPVDMEGMAAEDLAVADLDGDGLAEIIAGGRATQNVAIYWNRTKPDWLRFVISSNTKAQTATAADFNGDGKLDVIAADNPAKTVLLFEAPDWKRRTLLEGVDTIHSLTLDMNRDGRPDFVGARYSPGYLYWLEQPRGGGGKWPVHVLDDFAKGGVNGIHGVISGDVNRDGIPDVIGNSGQPNGTFPNSLAWFDGKTGQRHIFADRDAPGLSHYFGFGDVNGDGRPDIAVGAKIGPDGNYFAWWEQPADATKPWRKHVIATGQEGATNIAIVDVNKDGKPDFLATRGHGRGLVWFEAPNWTPHSINDWITGPHALAVGDIDNDGDVDAVTCAKDSLVTAWFQNDGKGNFTTKPIYEVQSCYDIKLVDMDKDGKLDVLVAGRETADVVWYRNQLR